MTEKESIPQKLVLIQLGEKLHDNVLEERQKIAESGIIMVRIDHTKGKIDKMEIRSRGFLFMDAKHEIFQLLEKEMRDVWTRQYDPARPEKGLEAPLKQLAEKILYKKFRKNLVVEVMV